jgi:hypothetical protein
VVIRIFFFLEGPFVTHTLTHVKSRNAAHIFILEFALTKRRAGKAEMKLVRKSGTTASQANRGKSVKNSITEPWGKIGYESFNSRRRAHAPEV